MKLTRRDALAALAAGGTVIGGTAALRWADVDDDDFGGHESTTLEAIAQVIYPSTVSEIPQFVETYVVGRYRDKSTHMRELVGAIVTLDEYAQTWYDDVYCNLDRQTQENVLSEMGLDVVDPVPDGTDVERVRYYVINELLYALYTSPTGGKLVGIENPQGYPGGIASYQRESR